MALSTGIKPLAVVPCAFNLVLVAAFLWGTRGLMPWDLPNFYFAGKLLAQGHSADLYHRPAYAPLIKDLRIQNPRAAAQKGIWFLRPAWEAWLCLPFGWLSYVNAGRVLIAANLLLLGLLVWLLPKWFPSPPLTRPMLMAFIPFVLCFAYGQDTLLLALLVGYGLYAADRKPTIAGVVLAMASFKPHVVFLLPIAMIASRRWGVLSAFLSAVAALALLSFATVGVRGLHEWAELLSLPTSDFGVDGMVNLRALGVHFGTPAMAAAAVLTAIAFLATLYRGKFLECASSALLVSLLVSPHSYVHDYSVLAVVALAACPIPLRYAVLIPWLYFVPSENLGLIALNLACLCGIAISIVRRLRDSRQPIRETPTPALPCQALRS